MSHKSQHGGDKKTVLLVEDDEQVRSVTKFNLTQLGYDVLEARGRPEALNMLEKGNHVDMILTDVGLPDGINGAELAKRVRKYRRVCPPCSFRHTTTIRWKNSEQVASMRACCASPT